MDAFKNIDNRSFGIGAVAILAVLSLYFVAVGQGHMGRHGFPFYCHKPAPVVIDQVDENGQPLGFAGGFQEQSFADDTGGNIVQIIVLFAVLMLIVWGVGKLGERTIEQPASQFMQRF